MQGKVFYQQVLQEQLDINKSKTEWGVSGHIMQKSIQDTFHIKNQEIKFMEENSLADVYYVGFSGFFNPIMKVYTLKYKYTN